MYDYDQMYIHFYTLSMFAAELICRIQYLEITLKWKSDLHILINKKMIAMIACFFDTV